MNTTFRAVFVQVFESTQIQFTSDCGFGINHWISRTVSH